MNRQTDRDYQRLLVRLKQARLDAELTQREVAAYLNRPQSFVAKCEAGERRIDAIELKRFAQVYGKKVEDFL